MKKKLGKRLTDFRNKAGLSIDELAEKLGVSKDTILSWENGESTPDTEKLIQLAKLYNASLDELVGNYKDEKINTKINIGPGHVDVVDEDGSEVHINFEKVEVIDKGKGVHIEKKKLSFNLIKLIGLPFVILLSSFALVVVLTYVIVGCTYKGTLGTTGVNAWAGLWPLFLLISVPQSFVRAVKHRRYCEFDFTMLVTSAYMFVGMLTGQWHPYWFLFLFIPLYFLVFGIIDNYNKKNKDIIDN